MHNPPKTLLEYLLSIARFHFHTTGAAIDRDGIWIGCHYRGVEFDINLFRNDKDDQVHATAYVAFLINANTRTYQTDARAGIALGQVC